ncbi:MAG: DUF2784 domain-containing protein [bacterium]|nr:DUF2784 domain-containing protein [bacterium]
MSPQFYTLAATVTVVIHALWIVWIFAGAFLPFGRRWRNAHLGGALLTVVFMATHGLCPLTDLEVYLQELAGREGYSGGFIAHYASAFVYGDLIAITPAGLMIATLFIAAVAVVLRWGKRLGQFKMK